HPLGLEKIQLEILSHQKVRGSKSTVYRVLLREGFLRKRAKGGKTSPKTLLRGSEAIISRSKEKNSSSPGEGPLLDNRYLLKQELGRGGGGIVYLDHDQKREDQVVALKVVEWEKEKISPLLAPLKNEFATLSALHHPNLGRVFDFGMTDQAIYFTSE